MKVTLTDSEGSSTLTDVQEINIGIGGELVITRADENQMFTLHREGAGLRVKVEPEPMNTRLKSAAAVVLATLPDCERCRTGDILDICACTRWCGVDYCLSDTLREGPSVLDPIGGDLWDKDRDALHDQAHKDADDAGSAG